MKLNFYLFADDTNVLYANNNLKSFESVVNEELRKVCEWLNTNKLSLNTSKSNFVIFHPFQRKPDYNVTLKMYDNDLKILTSLEQKHYVKYLDVLIDSHLSWRYHIDYISSKISKGVGIMARLSNSVPTSTLLKINRSLIEPYIFYGLIAWGQAANSSLNKILILQKRALRLMYFSDRRAHAIPLFVRSSVLPLNMLYFKYSAILMHDITNNRAPSKISEFFVRSNMIHSHYTRFSTAGNFYVQRSRLNQLLLSFSRSGGRIWSKIPLTFREQRKDPLRRFIYILLIKVLETKKV